MRLHLHNLLRSLSHSLSNSCKFWAIFCQTCSSQHSIFNTSQHKSNGWDRSGGSYWFGSMDWMDQKVIAVCSIWSTRAPSSLWSLFNLSIFMKQIHFYAPSLLLFIWKLYRLKFWIHFKSSIPDAFVKSKPHCFYQRRSIIFVCNLFCIFNIKWKIFMCRYCHHKATCIGFMSVCPLIYLLSCFPFAFMSLSGRYQFQHSNTKAQRNNTIWSSVEIKSSKNSSSISLFGEKTKSKKKAKIFETLLYLTENCITLYVRETI